MLNLKNIRDRLSRPFTPFALRLSDGRRIPVPHPEFIAVGRGYVVVIDAENSAHHIDTLHIVSMESAAAVEESAA